MALASLISITAGPLVILALLLFSGIRVLTWLFPLSSEVPEKKP